MSPKRLSRTNRLVAELNRRCRRKHEHQSNRNNFWASRERFSARNGPLDCAIADKNGTSIRTGKKANAKRSNFQTNRRKDAQEKGDWQFAYTRMFIEREAVLGAFNASDIRQNSNVSQHRLEAFYQAHRNVQLAFTGFFGRPLNSFGSSAPPEDLLKRLQFDVIYKF